MWAKERNYNSKPNPFSWAALNDSRFNWAIQRYREEKWKPTEKVFQIPIQTKVDRKFSEVQNLKRHFGPQDQIEKKNRTNSKNVKIYLNIPYKFCCSLFAFISELNTF